MENDKVRELKQALVNKTNELENDLELKEIVMNSLSNGVLAYTIPERNVLILNDEAKKIFELPLDFDGDINHFISAEIMKPNVDLIHETVQKIKKPGDVVRYQLKIPAKGMIKTVNVVTKFLQFENGEKFILSTMQDVTEEERLSKLLQDERLKYRDALIKNSEYFYSFDVTEGYLTDDIILPNGTGIVSSLGLKIPVHYDVLCQSLIEQTGVKFMSGDKLDSCQRIIEFVNQGNYSATLEHYSEQTGEYNRTVLLFSKDSDTGHIHAFVVETDITNERQKELIAQKALAEAYESATRANKAKTEFLSRMSHDIRTPMNAIIGMTAIADAHLEDQERVRDCLSKITVASKHLLALINDVLDMSKIESGRIDLQVDIFKISDLLDALVTISRPQVEEKGHTFIVNQHNIIHQNVMGDNQRLQQVFMNFISNSIKYTPGGGKITLDVFEKPTNKQNVGCYEFIIEDNGIGMTKEYMTKMFEPFSRAEDERVSKIQGTGLGMSIAQNLVQMMDGDIKVESEVNKGTKITVTIYLELVDSDVILEPQPQMPQTETHDFSLKQFEDSRFAGKKILLVEDNEINLEIAEEILKTAKFDIETARNGKEAVEKVSNCPDGYYDMIFMDVQMPIMTGHEAAREIRALGREYTNNVPIIAMTANAFSDDVIESKKAGMNEHIAKPLKFELLWHIINKWLK